MLTSWLMIGTYGKDHHCPIATIYKLATCASVDTTSKNVADTVRLNLAMMMSSPPLLITLLLLLETQLVRHGSGETFFFCFYPILLCWNQQ